MSDHKEQRRCDRCQYEDPVTSGYFNTGLCRIARTKNRSPDGMYIESDYFLRPGATVYLKLENKMSDASEKPSCACYGLRTVTLGEVKWCQELSAPGSSLYGIGLKYYESPY
jgi:hypothetical protein